MSLSIAKGDTAWRLHSKALADNQMSDNECHLIMKEFEQYNVLKEAIRAKLARSVRSEMEAEFRKKIIAIAAGSN